VIRLVLPVFSANRYWRPVNVCGHATIVPTKEAKAYKTEVAWLARKQGVRAPIAGRVSVHIELYPGKPKDGDKRARLDPANWDDDVRSIDLDNARKVLNDALIGVAFEDDKRIWRDSGERMEPDGEERVVVVVEAIPPRAVAQIALALPVPVPRETSNAEFFEPSTA
jgi:crossover junction endodeoxyribonuclease RusA